MTNLNSGMMAQSIPAGTDDRFTSHFDTNQVPQRNIQSPPLKLIRGGLSENTSQLPDLKQ